MFGFNLNACQHHFYDWKRSGQGCRAGLACGVPRDPDFVEDPNDQHKEFLAFWRLLFCGPPKLLGPWNSLFPSHLALPGRLNKLITGWNDRSLRRVFLCFCLAISKLTNVKFQTFAYNSKTVWSSYLKF